MHGDYSPHSDVLLQPRNHNLVLFQQSIDVFVFWKQFRAGAVFQEGFNTVVAALLLTALVV